MNRRSPALTLLLGAALATAATPATAVPAAGTRPGPAAAAVSTASAPTDPATAVGPPDSGPPSGSGPKTVAGLGSIVYIRAGNVWIMSGDGTAAHRVTTDGTLQRPYVSPTMSNAGVIAAGHLTDIVRMDQHGTVLSRFDPPALQNSAGEAMDGYVNDVAISPGGDKVAWTFVRYSCPGAGTDCTTRYATGYSAATEYRRVGRTVTLNAPSWVSENRTLSFGGFLRQVDVHDLPQADVHWFDDSDYAFPDTDLADGDLSPNGRWLALIRGYGADSAVAWYAVSGNAKSGPPPAVPEIRCVTGGQVGHADPTWSPSSQGLAWAGDEGVFLLRNIADCGAGRPATLVARGGTDPDWSPAAMS